MLYERKSRLSAREQGRLIEYFVAGATARAAAGMLGVQPNTAARFFMRLRWLIASKLPSYELNGEIEADESYFGGARKGKRGRGAAGKVAVFGLLKRRGKVFTAVVLNARSETLLPIIKEKVRPDSIMHTDTFRSYNALDVSEFHHLRINHSELFADQKNHINGIENLLIVDETGFIKKGVHSAGVKRQYSGTAGRIENSQVGVFLCYASDQGAALVDRALYVPREWAEDRERCRAAGIPDTVEFATKPEMARQMIGRALDAGVPVGWVAGDEVYGTDSKVRRMLEARQVSYVLAVASNQRLWWPDFQQRRVDAIAQSLPKRAWKRLSAGPGSKGERLYDWASVRLSGQQGWVRTLLVRRSLGEKPEHAYYLCYAPTAKSTLATLVRVAGQRWQIEQCFQTAKGECGLDHYEVRHWQGWQRHITLAMLAHAVLVVLRVQGKKNSLWRRTPQRSRSAPSAHPSAVARQTQPATRPRLA